MPQLSLAGQWLAKVGFNTGTGVSLKELKAVWC
ncbi:hypothetical protein QE436_000701 [Pantoea anthophila]|nr:hypothetical protein [Pantoea anthophila]